MNRHSLKRIVTGCGLLGCTLLGCTLFALACAKSSVPDQGTNTNWLLTCESNSECGDALDCQCGVCSRACDGTAACEDLGSDATCTEIEGPRCGEPVASCVQTCARTSDCGELDDVSCQAGLCVRMPSGSPDAAVSLPPEAGSGGTGGSSGSGGGGGSGGSGDRDGSVGPDTVLVRRDAEVQITDAYRACEQHTDCTLVDTGCNGCCQQGAIAEELETTYDENFVLACVGYMGGICDCQPQDLVARCGDGLCTALPREPARDCVSPTQNVEQAYQPGAVGCACDTVGISICVGPAALVCEMDGDAPAWIAVEDGPCEPRDEICPLPLQRATAGECVAEFTTCYRLPSGMFCGEDCYGPMDCTQVDCADYAALEPAPCTEFGIGAWEGVCGDIRYRTIAGGFFLSTQYWEVSSGLLVAADLAGDAPGYCGNTSNTLAMGDLTVIASCDAAMNDTTKICTD